MAPGFAGMLHHQLRKHRFTFLGRLQDAPGGNATVPPPSARSARHAARSTRRGRVTAQPVVFRRALRAPPCDGSQAGPTAHIASHPASVAVTWISSGLPAPIASATAHAAGSAPASDRREHRAAVDRYDVVRPIGRKADFQHAVRAAARVEDGAAPPLACASIRSPTAGVQPHVAPELHNEAAFSTPR